MTYPFVQAKWFSAGKREEVRALAFHFAEGGGTVGYFENPTRGNPPKPVDVSATFVIEYSGRIVQMVRDDDVDHCQHISYGTWSYPGGLSRSRGVAVLGADVMNQTDATRVNRYVQAIELEGFRAKGPNPAQEAALIALVAERRARFPELRGLLGHGDIQNKACPGALIPWDKLGGHGLFEEGDDVQTTVTIKTFPAPRVFRAAAGITTIRRFTGTGEVAGIAAPYSASVDAAVEIEQTDNRVPHGSGFLRISTGGSAGFFILASQVVLDPAADPVAAAVKVAVNAALDHVQPAATAVATAIAEARIR
ncbi:MAG TPA: N-acetylmuramoyl-L-alanine amidase [Candidatus Limnocylindrales bacterium]|nr:N-acetylmuramoyl-L-alanine amidase [Candidatus Limnocylindrales bacterium]